MLVGKVLHIVGIVVGMFTSNGHCYSRENERMLHPLEQQEGTKHMRRPLADRSRTVKRFSRSAAGQKQPSPRHVRPPKVLQETVYYLLSQ